MKPALIALLIILPIAWVGFRFQYPAYQLARPEYPQDQILLAKKTSPYSSISWVLSDSHNYAELRFFDRVEGGICLSPSWADLTAINESKKSAPTDPGPLAHVLRPDTVPSGLPTDPLWPKGRAKPDMGPLPHSAYVNLYPAGLLLNQKLDGKNPREVPLDILVIGLGSGIGPVSLAYHFPKASITVVDIDPAVAQTVIGHYPLFAHLASTKHADGRPRIRMEGPELMDARQYVRHKALARNGRPFDMIIVDAYTDGSTIPPHLMTTEFYKDLLGALDEKGIVLSNIISSYTGKKHLVLGGALRSHQLAGFSHIHCFPILRNGETFLEDRERNTIVVASRCPLDPKANRSGWERLEAHVPFPELALNTYTTKQAQLVSKSGRNSSQIEAKTGIGATFKDQGSPSTQELAAVREAYPGAINWDDTDTKIYVTTTDWLHFCRSVWTTTVAEARAITAREFTHAGETLVGPPDESPRTRDITIADPPIFTDARPNADIFNR